MLNVLTTHKSDLNSERMTFIILMRAFSIANVCPCPTHQVPHIKYSQGCLHVYFISMKILLHMCVKTYYIYTRVCIYTFMRPKESDAVIKEKICNSNLPNGRWKWRSSEAWDESHRPGISLHDLTGWGSKQKWGEGTKQEWVGVDNLKLRMYENSMETTILHANLKIWFFRSKLNTGTLHRWFA